MTHYLYNAKNFTVTTFVVENDREVTVSAREAVQAGEYPAQLSTRRMTRELARKEWAAEVADGGVKSVDQLPSGSLFLFNVCERCMVTRCPDGCCCAC